MATPEFHWLEDIESPRALEWVDERNEHSLARLARDARFEPLMHAAIENYTATDRIPYGVAMGGLIHNFWQDREHIRGIWRTTTLEEYASSEPGWLTVLDIDALAEEEDEDWVYKGRTCLGPDCNRCLVHLSAGGGDAVEIREFDLPSGNFVSGGFFVPRAKTNIEWLDEDRLLIATDFGHGTLTSSGYPREIRVWHRGTPLSQAKLLYRADASDMLVAPRVIHRAEGAWAFVIRRPSFFTEEAWLIGPDLELRPVPVPPDAMLLGVFAEMLVIELRTQWSIDEKVFSAGSLVSLSLESIDAGTPIDPKTICSPTRTLAIKSSSLGRDAIFVSAMDDVDGVLLELRPGPEGAWVEKRIKLPPGGNIDIVCDDPLDDIVMLSYESFLTPPTLFLLDQGAEPRAIKSMPAQFDTGQLQQLQYFATSRDGTRVPYYVVGPTDLPGDGSSPTYMFGYGGFEIPLTPAYPTAINMEWLKAGGVYVQANLRGGGEYGPGWHHAALLDQRQRAYDDFIAVAEDLIRRGITSPKKLGIRGRSNGGLLVTAVMVQRPDLFNAIICGVPLVDMLRYHKLSAGASWMAEYGDPDIPEQAEFIARYSPYQNVKEDTEYPEVFFWTNRKDDRVHPSHARRMVANMLSKGHPVLYFENAAGGHAGGGDPLALARVTALELVYLMQKLMD